jgi:hypothetical protein
VDGSFAKHFHFFLFFKSKKIDMIGITRNLHQFIPTNKHQQPSTQARAAASSRQTDRQ